MCTCFSLAPVAKLCALKCTENRPLCTGNMLHLRILSSVRRAQIIALVLCCGCYDQTDDQAVQDPKATEFERKDWVINDSECLRPYGVLIREISLQDYIPAEAMVYGFDHPHVKKLMQDIRDGK